MYDPQSGRDRRAPASDSAPARPGSAPADRVAAPNGPGAAGRGVPERCRRARAAGWRGQAGYALCTLLVRAATRNLVKQLLCPGGLCGAGEVDQQVFEHVLDKARDELLLAEVRVIDVGLILLLRAE